jgi:hypothetical protein
MKLGRAALLLVVGACSFPEYRFQSDGTQDPVGPDAAGAAQTGVCDDHVKGPTETDIDCGGLCPACVLGQACLHATDCESGMCVGNICQAPTCSDGVANGAESDVDCGGSCKPCKAGLRCVAAADCAMGICLAGTCQAATCSDGVLNGDETGIDCGGSCPSKCASGITCRTGADCITQSCDKLRLLCVDASCLDQVKNGSETDTDCGGLVCAPCAASQGCTVGADCSSAVCDTAGGRCVAASCTDSIRNQDETDVDCGGTNCKPCGTKQACLVPQDCSSDVCQSQMCVPNAATGVELPRTGWNATASSTLAGSSLAQAYDGDVATAWTSRTAQASGMWFELDLGQTQVFFAVRMDSQQEPVDAPMGYQISFSEDGNFNSSPQHGPYPGAPISAFKSTTAIVARYIKMELTQPQSTDWSIDEIHVFQ